LPLKKHQEFFQEGPTFYYNRISFLFKALAAQFLENKELKNRGALLPGSPLDVRAYFRRLAGGGQPVGLLIEDFDQAGDFWA